MLKKCQKSHVLPMKNVTVCTFKASPCVPAPRAHVFQHVRVDARRVFLRAKPRHTPHHTKHTHTPLKPRTPTHNNTRRQRQRQTETEKEDRDRERREDGRGETRQEKIRQKKTRQDKRREKIHFQCGGAWPFFVDVVIFWLIPFAHET